MSRYLKDSLLLRHWCVLVCVCRGEYTASAVREAQGDIGAKLVPEPGDGTALTTAPWCGIRREEE